MRQPGLPLGSYHLEGFAPQAASERLAGDSEAVAAKVFNDGGLIVCLALSCISRNPNPKQKSTLCGCLV